MGEMILAPFRKQNIFNTLMKDGKFGTDLVDSMLKTPQASDIIFHNYFMLKSLNISWSLMGMLMFSCASK